MVYNSNDDMAFHILLELTSLALIFALPIDAYALRLRSLEKKPIHKTELLLRRLFQNHISAIFPHDSQSVRSGSLCYVRILRAHVRTYVCLIATTPLFSYSIRSPA